jgi:hypothetical protein
MLIPATSLSQYRSGLYLYKNASIIHVARGAQFVGCSCLVSSSFLRNGRTDACTSLQWPKHQDTCKRATEVYGTVVSSLFAGVRWRRRPFCSLSIANGGPFL